MAVPVGMEGSVPITAADIAAAEHRLGFPIPEALATFCLRENGGMPQRSWIIDDDRDIESEVDWFIPIEPATATDLNGVVHIYQQMVREQALPASALPFAHDAGGNVFLLDRTEDRVWFMPMDEWHHAETPDQNWARSGRTITTSFADFLDALTDEPPEWARD